MISIGVCLYIIMNNAIMMNNQISANLASFASINSQLSSSTLTTEQRASLLAQQTELMRILFSDVSEMNNNFKVVYSFDLIFILYFVRSLFHIIHSKITDKVIPNQIYYSLIIDGINSVMVLYTFIRYLTYYSINNSSPTNPNEGLSRAVNDKYLNIMYSISFTVFSQCVRILLFIRATKELGYLLEIIGIVMFKIIRFGVIYFIVMVIFVTTGRILFFDIPNYSTYTDCTTTLFSAALGQFDLTVFNDNYLLNKYYGYTFLVIYIFITNIVLLNFFLIAVLSSIYSNLKQNSSGLYLRNIAMVQNVFNIKSKYACLAYAYVPFTSIMGVFLPFMFCRFKKQLNMFLIHMYYIPVMLFASSLFFICSLLLIPIAYVAVIFVRIREVIMGSGSLLIRLIICFSSILIGVLILILVCFCDTMNFSISLYTSKTKLKNPPSLDDDLASKIVEICGEKSIRYFMKIIEKKQKSQKHVDSVELIKEIRNQFMIFEQIKSILYAVPSAKFQLNLLLEFGSKGRKMRRRKITQQPLKEIEWEHLSESQFSNSKISINQIGDDEDLIEILKEDPEKILKLYNLIKKFILRNSIDTKMENFSQKEIMRKELISLNQSSIRNLEELREQLRPQYQLNVKGVCVGTKILKESIEKDKINSILNQKYNFSYKPSKGTLHVESKEEILNKEKKLINTVFTKPFHQKYIQRFSDLSISTNILTFCN